MDRAPPEILELIARGALFVINDSGGKDSQAMKIILRRLVPARQLLIVHAILPEVEWSDAPEHVERYAGDVPVIYAQAGKTLLEMVERNGRFPIANNRQCTSDLKRDPIDRELRRYLRKHPEFGDVIVQCIGLRAQESRKRAKAKPFTRYKRGEKAGREWHHWLPIHALTEEEVFATIAEAGQEPHWVYPAGMSRFSCCFCIFGTASDFTIAAKLVPDLYGRYCAMERKIGHTLSMSQKFLPEITGIPG